jgi:hypothetical protein
VSTNHPLIFRKSSFLFQKKKKETKYSLFSRDYIVLKIKIKKKKSFINLEKKRNKAMQEKKINGTKKRKNSHKKKEKKKKKEK